MFTMLEKCFNKMKNVLGTLESSTIQSSMALHPSPEDLCLCFIHHFIHSLIHSLNESSLLTAMKKEDKHLLSRFLPAVAEGPYQVINKTITNEEDTVGKVTT